MLSRIGPRLLSAPLIPPEPLRLYGKRAELKDKLLATIGQDEGAMAEMMATLKLPAELKV